MGYLAFSKSWSSNDDGIIPTGVHLGQLQADVAAILNNLSDANFSSAAAIVESKFSFDTSTGHDHDGVNSKTVDATDFIMKHFRSGAHVSRTAAGTLSVSPGHIEIGGTLYNLTTATTLTLATATDWVFGSETSNAPAYVYAYNNSGTLAFKLSTEAPDLSDTSSNSTESPWRYQQYSNVFYRCVGAVWNNASGDIESGSETNFDASEVRPFKVLHNGAAITLPTIWTPDVVVCYGASQDSTPAATENFGDQVILFRQLSTDYSLNIKYDTGFFLDPTTANSTTVGGGITVTAQSAGTGGSISFTAGTAGLVSYGFALCREPF